MEARLGAEPRSKSWKYPHPICKEGTWQSLFPQFKLKQRNSEGTNCPVEDGFLSTTAVQLAMIACRTNSKVEWSASTEALSGPDEAKKL